MDVDTTFRKCIRIQNPVDGTNSWSVGKAGATWRRRVVLISTGRTERLSQRLTKLKPHLTPAPYIDQTPVRIHFRKVVSTSTGYRSNIWNLYPIQTYSDSDTSFSFCIRKKYTDTIFFNPIQIRNINKYKILLFVWIFWIGFLFSKSRNPYPIQIHRFADPR